jgi:hypothetical protein
MVKEHGILFIHGQGYNELDPTLPSERGIFEAEAVKVLLEKGYSFGTYVFSGIAFSGKNNMPMSQVTARAVHRIAGVSPNSMVILETARTTSEEVRDAAKINNGLKRVAHLTYGGIHPDQVRRHALVHYAQDIEVVVFRADEILTDPSGLTTDQSLENLQRYQNEIVVYNSSDTETRILKYEQSKETFMEWKGDLGNKLLNGVARFYRPDPAQSDDIFLLT